MSNEEQPSIVPPSPPDYDTIKKQIEIDKLNKEILQLDLEMKRKWYRKPQWIAALSPIFLGLLTFLIAFATGFLQNQSTLNRIQEENFTKRKQAINDSISQLKYLSDSLSNYVSGLHTQKNMLDSAVGNLNLLKDDLLSRLSRKDKELGVIIGKYIAIQEELIKLRQSTPAILSSEDRKMVSRQIQFEKHARGINEYTTIAEVDEWIRRNQDSLKQIRDKIKPQ